MDIELEALGVRLDGQLAEFFRRYRITFFQSAVSYVELCDILDPTPEVAIGTRFVREVWELPRNFVCLTSAEGEGAYLYDVLTEAVWDLCLADRDSFVSGRARPTWDSFYDFLTWYLNAEPASE